MLEMDILGGQKLETDLQELSAGLESPGAWLAKDAAPLAAAAVRQQFESGGSPEPWPDITAKSRAQRKINKDSGPLIDSGALMAAASADQPGVAGSVFAQQGDLLTLGTDLVYAATQQFGRGGIPARPFEELTLTDEIRLTQSMDDDYLHALVAAMG